MYSLLPRCHGDAGSQKYTFMFVARAKLRCSAISAPWSQVRDLRKMAGSGSTVSTSASFTEFALKEPPRWLNRSIRQVRSTSDATAD